MEQQGKICPKCKIWKPMEEFHKCKSKKDGRQSYCISCRSKARKRITRDEIKEEKRKCTKCGQWKLLEEYHRNKACKGGRLSRCKECQKEYGKQYRQNNKERLKESRKQYYQNNKEREKECNKQYRQKNKEHISEQQKQYRKNNKEYINERTKQYLQRNKENNLQVVSNMIEQIKPIFKELNLPIYGYIYKFENIKTGHVYIGQTIRPLKRRYKNGIVKGWIRERKHYENQKFLDELIEDDFEVTDVLDVGICKYHLDKTETYWINHYNSYNNGYNNQPGNYNTDDGLEEFMEILEKYNLEFINDELRRK